METCFWFYQYYMQKTLNLTIPTYLKKKKHNGFINHLNNAILIKLFFL